MKIYEKIKLNIRGYKTIHQLVPGFLGAIFVESAAVSLLPYINIFMSARIITALAEGKELRDVLILVLITVLLNFAVDLILKAMDKLNDYYWSKYWTTLDEPVNEKIRQMDYERIEDINTHLMKEQINIYHHNSGLALVRLMWSFSELLRNFFQVIFGFSLIAGAFTTHKTVNSGFWSFIFKPWFAAVIIGFMILNIVMEIYRVSVSTKKKTAAWSEFQNAQRIENYYYIHINNYKSGKDLKIYALKKLISVEFRDYLMELGKNVMKRIHRITMKYDSLAPIMSVVLTGIIYAYVAVKSLFGSFGVGSIVQYVGSLGRFGAGIGGLVSELTMLMVNAENLADYFAFLDIPSKMYQGTLSVEKRDDNDYSIEFRNVSFKYPGTDTYALKNFNLKCSIGKRMAVVGMNGSGKTTMIKLLCRLYDPTEGEILLNGIDIRKYKYNEYLDLFSVVFQDFKLFSFSLGQNVATSVEYDGMKAAKCLDMAGFGGRLDNMPKGLETPLYKDFEEEGVEISGGEAQKIALARALYKDAPFIVLDEPTAALDPIAEFEIYSKFNEIVGGKTAIFISHRLSSCRFCDDIAVFHEGELIQRGSHDTLIADKNGKYYELWNAQAQYYAENKESDNINAAAIEI